VHVFGFLGPYDLDLTLREVIFDEHLDRHAKAYYRTYSAHDPSGGVPWPCLKEEFKRSTREWRDFLDHRMLAFGQTWCTLPWFLMASDENGLTDFAAMEHSRWYAERRLDRWEYADNRDDRRKLNPLLRGWAHLHQDARDRSLDWDRKNLLRLVKDMQARSVDRFRPEYQKLKGVLKVLLDRGDLKHVGPVVNDDVHLGIWARCLMFLVLAAGFELNRQGDSDPVDDEITEFWARQEHLRFMYERRGTQVKPFDELSADGKAEKLGFAREIPTLLARAGLGMKRTHQVVLPATPGRKETNDGAR
jgi:hypothetical protein